jgi:hypothetical protein
LPVDWLRLIQQHGIEHGVQRDELLVRCPWCSDQDPSQHLSINLRGRGYRCLRQPQRHKGRNAVRLAAALFKCDEVRARKLIGFEEAPLPAKDQFKEQWRKQLGLDGPADARPTRLDWPEGCYSLIEKYRRHSPFAVTFWNYLHRRGFTDVLIEYVAERYQLRYTIEGEFAFRLIIPIFDEIGHLATWTGRAIGDRLPRYKTLTREASVQSPSELLLGFNWLVNAAPARMLVVCEGPLDAIKVTALGGPYGIWGTCLFGKQISRPQTGYLYALKQFFENIVLLLDEDARLNCLEIASNIPGCHVAHLPPGIKDPGDLGNVEFLCSLLESLDNDQYESRRRLPR